MTKELRDGARCYRCKDTISEAVGYPRLCPSCIIDEQYRRNRTKRTAQDNTMTQGEKKIDTVKKKLAM